MEIRPYKSSDFYKIKTWVNNERDHALWCANLIPYPLEKHGFEKTLKEISLKNNDIPLVSVTEKGDLAGFFCYGINSDTKVGKLKFIIISPTYRNKGYGKEMVSLAVKNAFDNQANSVELNVFSCNIKAKKCYSGAGFSVRLITENAFRFKNEIWTRYNMTIETNNNKRDFKNAI